ncbi:prolyl oligopeptidase family serine peptidase [Paracoccus pacificus]|uniref:Prolyl oligopeptidase family serine peptidase n=1 Tax=Paracoccus pacificus TaxID=1463598 RepID=A0ABW4R5T8_9RHOB
MSDYIGIPEVTKGVLSADGEMLVYLSNQTGLNQIWTVAIRDGRPSGAARQLTDLPERVVDLAFAPVGKNLIYTTDCGMDERFQIWLLADGTARPLTNAPGRVHVWGCWAPDGGRIAFASNERDARQMDVHVLDLASGIRQTVWQGEGYAQPLAFAADGRLLIRDSRRSMRDQDLLWVDPATGTVTAALPSQGPAQHLSVKLAPDGGPGIVLTDQGSDVTRPCRFDTATGALTPVYEVPGWEIEKIALPQARDRMACLVNRDGMNDITLIDLTTGAETRLGAPGNGIINELSFSKDGTRLLLDFASPSQPSGIWTWTEAEGFRKLDLLPEQRVQTAHVSPEVRRFDSFDGLEVPYFLYTPQGPRPEAGWPVLFLIHGGPEMQWKAQYRPDIAWYLDRGIMVVAPNVRGSSGYGRRYCAADDHDKRMEAVGDLLALRDHIAGWPETDPARTGVAGQSYGGFMVLAALTEAPGRWSCGIDIYGVSNFTTMMKTTGPWRQVLRAAEYGDPVRDAELLHRISPMTRIERIEVPLLIVHANDDPRVAIEQGEQVWAALRGLDRPVEYLRIEHEGHGFSRLANRSRVFETISDFLARNLLAPEQSAGDEK